MAISPRIRNALFIGAASIAALYLVALLVVKHYEGNARTYAIQALQDQFGGNVTVGSLTLSVFPGVRGSGADIVVRLPGTDALPPLIRVKRFTLTSSLTAMRIASITLDGLEVHVPPAQEGQPRMKASGKSFFADEVTADGAFLEILPRDAGKDSLKFQARRLHLSSAANGAMAFHVELNNATPPGLIKSDGQFGPWSKDSPGGTPVSGQYTFSHADLAVFKGIRGTLSSQGKYQGELAKLEVQGTADVPDFVLALAGNAVPLRTNFSATVDAQNGNTVLHPVNAVLGTSAFEVTGSIERGALVQGRELNLTTRSANKSAKDSLQDFLRLTIKGKQPPITGTLTFESKIRIPPGPGPNVEKVQLDGQFHAEGVKFTSSDVQEKMASLSHRAEGDPQDHDPAVAGSMSGRFILKDGVMTLPRLAFNLPGARVNLDGTYTLTSGLIDFKGTARLDAKVSQMTTGIKRVLLKPVDPLFEHDGAGAVVPIVVGGKRADPSFRLDIGRAIKGH